MQSILDAINEWIKEILIGAINGNLSTMFGDVNEKVGTIAAEVGQTPQGWNANIFSMIYAVLVNNMIIADNLHSAIFSLAAYTVILCFSLFKSGALAKSIFSAH